MLTKKQLVKLLENEDNLEIIHYEDKKVIDFEGFKIQQEEQFGGESQGDSYWIVFSVKKDDKVEYWEIPGFYQSNYGSEIEILNIFQVKPVQVTVRQWQAVK